MVNVAERNRRLVNMAKRNIGTNGGQCQDAVHLNTGIYKNCQNVGLMLGETVTWCGIQIFVVHHMTSLKIRNVGLAH